MPYRRLPKTDTARLKALKTVLKQGNDDGIYSSVVSQKSQHEAQLLLVKYEQILHDYKQVEEKSVRCAKNMQKNAQKSRLYISHFIQVLNLSVVRGEVTVAQKELYELPSETNVVPDLSTDKRLLDWGRKIIKGEALRQQHGGVPIYNPNIAKVRAFFDPFESDMEELRIQKMNVSRCYDELKKIREQIDVTLLDIWNQVEHAFENLSPKEKLDKCQEYGLVYYYRRGEEKLA